jgi:hypothetical protein
MKPLLCPMRPPFREMHAFSSQRSDLLSERNALASDMTPLVCERNAFSCETRPTFSKRSASSSAMSALLREKNASPRHGGVSVTLGHPKTTSTRALEGKLKSIWNEKLGLDEWTRAVPSSAAPPWTDDSAFVPSANI